MPEEEKMREGTNWVHCEQTPVRGREEGVEVTSEAVLVGYADLANQVTYVCHQ